MELIAEVGCNWTSMGNAKDYIHKCKELGIKFVKFQMFKPEQVPTSVKHLIIGKREAAELFAFGQLEDVNVFFTPFYVEAVDILEELGVNYYKIRALDRFFSPLKTKINNTHKTTFISGEKSIPSNWISLECISQYPCPFWRYTLGEQFEGVSDHTPNVILYDCALDMPHIKWFEMHVCYSHDDIEGKWSKTFEEIESCISEY